MVWPRALLWAKGQVPLLSDQQIQLQSWNNPHLHLHGDMHSPSIEACLTTLQMATSRVSKTIHFLQNNQTKPPFRTVLSGVLSGCSPSPYTSLLERVHSVRFFLARSFKLNLGKLVDGWMLCSRIGNNEATTKVCRPFIVTFICQTAIFEWCVVRCRSKSRHQKVTCLKEIGLHAQNLLNALGSIFIILGGLLSSRIFTLVMHKIFTWAPEIVRQMAMDTIWNWQSSRTNCVVSHPRRSGCRAKSVQLRPAYLNESLPTGLYLAFMHVPKAVGTWIYFWS